MLAVLVVSVLVGVVAVSGRSPPAHVVQGDDVCVKMRQIRKDGGG